MTSATATRYQIAISPVWAPFMLFIGATRANSYAEIDGDEVRLRMGPGFNQTISRANIIAAAPISWSIFDGVGVRAGGRIVGLIGALGGVVELQTRESVTLRFAGFPWTVRRIAISMEDPDAFIAAVTAL
mgnify:CR=1 FL=1